MGVSTIKIMVVEDDTTYIELLSSIINGMGYELAGVVDNAFAALKLVEEALPDIILIDTDIKDVISGTELAARINTNRRIPIIFLTAFRDQQTFRTGRLISPMSYIVKPFDPVSLQSAIELAIFTQPVPDATVLQPAAMGDTLYIKDHARVLKVRLRDILLIEVVDDKFCFIVTEHGSHSVNITLMDLLARLPREDFIQVHTLFAVRKSGIKAVNFGEQTVRVADKDIPIGRNYRQYLLSTLNLMS